jgi:integral membrane protein
VKAALLRYRVLANIVGVLLIVLVLVGLPLNELHHLNAAWFPNGTSAQQVGSWISRNLGVAHGWLYMIFLVMAFWLSRKAKWSLSFTAVTLICGTVPILSFWAEHRATRHVRAQMSSSVTDSRSEPLPR